MKPANYVSEANKEETKMKSETKLFILLVCYVVLHCILLSLFPGNVPHNHFLTGLFLGSIFGVTILTAIWAVLGPGRVAVRLFCAATLTSVLPLVSSFAVRSNFLIAIVAAQLAIVVTLLTIAAICKTYFGVHLHQSKVLELEIDQVAAQHQFGIRHLLIVTSVVAVLLAVGPMALLFLKSLQFKGWLIWGFLAFGTCISCIPFLLSVLSLRRCLIPILVLFVLAGLATVGESFLFESLKMSGPDLVHFIWINFFALLPILFVSTGLRLIGYRLVRRSSQVCDAMVTEGEAPAEQ